MEEGVLHQRQNAPQSAVTPQAAAVHQIDEMTAAAEPGRLGADRQVAAVGPIDALGVQDPALYVNGTAEEHVAMVLGKPGKIVLFLGAHGVQIDFFDLESSFQKEPGKSERPLQCDRIDRDRRIPDDGIQLLRCFLAGPLFLVRIDPGLVQGKAHRFSGRFEQCANLCIPCRGRHIERLFVETSGRLPYRCRRNRTSRDQKITAGERSVGIEIFTVLDLDGQRIRAFLCVGACDQLHELAVSVQRIDVAEKRRFPGAGRDRRKDVHHGLSELHIRRGACLLHDRIHPAADKCDSGEALFQFPVDVTHIASRKVMQAHREDNDGLGKALLTPFGAQLTKDVRHAFQGDLLEPACQNILFLEHNTGEAVDRVHFGRGHDHAPHTVVGTNVDLMGLRQKHADMHDVPGLMDRRIEFQACRKWAREGGVSDGNAAWTGCIGMRAVLGRHMERRLNRIGKAALLRDLVRQRSELRSYGGSRKGADNRSPQLFRFLYGIRAVQRADDLCLKIRRQFRHLFLFALYAPPVQDNTAELRVSSFTKAGYGHTNVGGCVNRHVFAGCKHIDPACESVPHGHGKSAADHVAKDVVKDHVGLVGFQNALTAQGFQRCDDASSRASPSGERSACLGAEDLAAVFCFLHI